MMARAAKPYLMLGLCVLAAIGAAVFIHGGGGSGHEYDSVVTGTVTVDGSPAKSGTFVFHPEKTGQPAIGRIHSDGSYSLRTGQGNLTKEDGGTVASGDYVVTASVTGASSAGDFVGEGGPPKPGRSLIDSKYATKDSSDFRFAVKPGRQVIDLRLKSASLEAATDQKPVSREAADASLETKAASKGEAKFELPNENKKPAATAPKTDNSTARPEK